MKNTNINEKDNNIYPITKIPHPYNYPNWRSPISFYPPLMYPDEQYVFMDDRNYPHILPEKYMISNYGNVWDAYKNTFVNQKIDRPGLKLDGTIKGYMVFKIYFYRDPFTISTIHVRTNRMVLISFNYIPGCEQLEANHVDGNHSNNRLSNLNWMTRRENIDHAVQNKLFRNGENCRDALLTNEEADKICKMMANGVANKEISETLKVDYEVIRNIRRGHSYRHISSKYEFPESESKTTPLSDETVIKICELLASEERARHIAQKLNISPSTIGRIRNREVYQDISSRYEFPELRNFNAVDESIIRDICERLQNGQKPSIINKETGYSKQTINSILTGHGYKYISKDYTFPQSFKELNDDIVIGICEELMKGESTYTDIAKKFNINSSIVNDIKSQSTYKHITTKYNFPTQRSIDISPEIVHEICRRFQDGESVAKVSKLMNIPSSKLYHIKYRETHTEISKNYKW